MKYIVMECHPSYAVVLDEEGRFLKAANMHYQVGQTVTDIVEMQVTQPQVRKGARAGWLYPLVAAACLLLLITAAVRIDRMPYGSIYLTINPQVRIEVNRRDVVVGLEGMNADGIDLLEGYLYKRKDLDVVMDELVDRAIEMGYLSQGGRITLTLDAQDNEWVVTHSDALTTHLNEYLTDKIQVTIDISGEDSHKQEISIPIGEQESRYKDSDYGNTGSDAPSAEAGNRMDTEEKDSGYDQESEENSDYSMGQEMMPTIDDHEEHQPVGQDDTRDDGQTDYGQTDYGQTDYDMAEETENQEGTEASDSYSADQWDEDDDNDDEGDDTDGSDYEADDDSVEDRDDNDD